MNRPASRRQPARQFTPEEANATLPLVRAISQDLANRSLEVHELRQRLEVLTEGRDDSRSDDDPYAAELAHMREELSRQELQVREYTVELQDLGVIPRVGPDGKMSVVDFPSVLDGREVHLCWRLGEPEVAHWHERDAGFDGRQPLPHVSGGVGG